MFPPLNKCAGVHLLDFFFKPWHFPSPHLPPPPPPPPPPTRSHPSCSTLYFAILVFNNKHQAWREIYNRPLPSEAQALKERSKFWMNRRKILVQNARQERNKKTRDSPPAPPSSSSVAGAQDTARRSRESKLASNLTAGPTGNRTTKAISAGNFGAPPSSVVSVFVPY